MRKILDGLDVSNILTAVTRNPNLWRPWRLFRDEDYQNPNSEAILLRFQDCPHFELQRLNKEPELTDRAAAKGLECVDTTAYLFIPEVREVVARIMWLTRGERLGRILFLKLKPGACVRPHNDAGHYANYYQRIYIPILAEEGNQFRQTGEDWIWMKPGEAWFFNQSIEHEAQNLSGVDRITLLVDVHLPMRKIIEYSSLEIQE